MTLGTKVEVSLMNSFLESVPREVFSFWKIKTSAQYFFPPLEMDKNWI